MRLHIILYLFLYIPLYLMGYGYSPCYIFLIWEALYMALIYALYMLPI